MSKRSASGSRGVSYVGDGRHCHRVYTWISTYVLFKHSLPSQVHESSNATQSIMNRISNKLAMGAVPVLEGHILTGFVLAALVHDVTVVIMTLRVIISLHEKQSTPCLPPLIVSRAVALDIAG